MVSTQAGKRKRPPRELKPSLADAVTRRLRDDIVVGKWPPGGRLFEVRLAEEYGVSRVPVRESLRRLEVEGFVTVLPNRGAAVNSLTEKEALELVSVRACLEREAAREAAANRTASDLAQMWTILDESHPLLESGDFDGLARLNTEFHQALFVASGNRTATVLVAPLWSKITWSYSVRVGSLRSRRSWDEHRRVVEHIERQDGDAAAVEIDRHLDAAAKDRHIRFPASADRLAAT